MLNGLEFQNTSQNYIIATSNQEKVPPCQEKVHPKVQVKLIFWERKKKPIQLKNLTIRQYFKWKSCIFKAPCTKVLLYLSKSIEKTFYWSENIWFQKLRLTFE